jgi:cytochrome c oxidase assembly protein Cox11|tara:strand:+ start:174 stop:509 length:336 start_codon:yes stop_codon:yes gene_type:complete
MLVEISVFVGILCWVISAIMIAAMIGAMFSPDKQKVTTRIIISCLLLVPSIVIIPLSFAAFILLSVICTVLGLTIFGIRIALELLRDGIPEMDENGNIIEVESTSTAPWVL